MKLFSGQAIRTEAMSTMSDRSQRARGAGGWSGGQARGADGGAGGQASRRRRGGHRFKLVGVIGIAALLGSLLASVAALTLAQPASAQFNISVVIGFFLIA